MSQTPAAGRHSAVLFASGGQVVLVPVHVSVTSQTPAAARQTAPAFPAGCWQKLLDPSQTSVLHGLPSSVHAVPADFFASAGQATPVPVQFSARSHSPPAARQTVLDEAKPSGGQTLLVPVQVSATSQTPAEARQTAPALPAGCWQASLEPSHSSTVQGLPSEVHTVPADFFASAGQFGPVPVQFSVRSHSSTAARQTVLDGWKASAGHVGLVPVQVSATSQTPFWARQVAPALPAGCWHALFVPSH
jgi:hypothetical protein